MGTLKDMIENSDKENEGKDIVPIPGPVSGQIFRKMVEWAQYHKDDPPPSEDDNMDRRTDDIPLWDKKFLDVDHGMLFELILAANYLEIKGLLDLSCKTVANMMKGKSAEEIRTIFNIKCDFTPSELEQVTKENEWCEEHH